MNKCSLAFLDSNTRKLWCSAIMLLFLINYKVTAQIATYSFTGAAGDEATFAADAQPSNGSISDMSRGGGLTEFAFADGFNAFRWPTGGSPNSNDYYEFTITPDCDFSITLTSLVLDERYDDINSNDSYNWVVRSSIDGFASDIGTPFTVNATTAGAPGITTGNTIDLTGGTFDNLAQAVTFRLYAYSLQQNDMEWGIDNVILNGSINALTDLHTVNFEIDECGYESVNAVRGGNNSYFRRFNKNNEASGPGPTDHDFNNVPLTNVQGDYYWALEQNNGQVIFPPVASPLDVTSLDNLVVRILIGAPGSTSSYDAVDSLAVQYTYDGGANYTTIGAFYGTGASAFYEDTDLDGSANALPGNILDQNLRELTYNIPKSGTNLNLRIIARTTGNNEEVVFDNIRVQGATDNTAPIVSAPINTPQELRGGVTSTSTVQSNELSDIYLVLNGVAASTPAEIATAVAANNAFHGRDDAAANTPYTVTPLATLNDGVYDIVAVDPAENVSTILAGWLTVDNTDPAIPAALNLDNADDTGSSNTDNITQTTSGLTIDGTGENGSTITLTSDVDGALAGSAVVSGGSWSFDIALSDNAVHSITAIATDVAGNTSAASAPIVIRTDNTVSAPASLNLDNTDDTGTSDTDNITQTLTGLTIDGTGEDGAVVSLTSNVDGALAGSATVSGGTWSLDITLSDNATHTITAVQTDLAGNISTSSTGLVITTDNTDPATPAALDLDNADDTGSSNTDNITQTISGLTIGGTGEDGSTIALNSNVDGAIAGSATVSGGTWSLDITLSDNAVHSITAEATDVAGNISSTSATLIITTDNTDPTTPAALNLDNADDTGISNTDNITQTTSGLTIDGTGENGSTITLTSDVDGALAGSTTVSGGTWSFDITLSDNAMHSITAIATDVAGNTSTASAPIVIRTDNTVSAPASLNLDNADDTGTSDTDNITQTLTGLTIDGTGEDGAVVSLTSNVDGALAGSATVSGGTWSLDITLSDNTTHTITAVQTDLAGNTSTSSTGLVITTDNTDPATPAALDLDNADDTGSSNTDNITQTTSGLTIGGTGEDGSTVTLNSNVDGALAGSATVSGGTWSLDVNLSDNAVHSITAEATDVAGNISSTSATLIITTDNTDPTIPGSLNLDNADDTGISNTDNITQTTSGLTIDGTGENGSTITLTSDVDGALAGSAVVSGGSWFFDITLSDNAVHSITAIATDVAGNTSTSSGPLVIITDNTAPFLSPNEMTLSLNGGSPETVIFTLSEELAVMEAGSVTGFSSSTGTISTAIYTGKGTSNIITLSSATNGDWTEATTISYANSNNVVDIAGNELGAIVAQNISISEVSFAAGDIAFTGYNSDGPDNFSFVLLKDAEIGTKIRFTDNGYNGQSNALRNSERTLVWEATSRIFAGTEIVIDNDETNALYTVECTCVETNGLSLSNNGDQVLAYQGSSADPTFIAGIHMDGNDIDGTTSWTRDNDVDNDRRSSLPPGLTNGLNAIALSSSEVDNARHDYNVNTGTVSALLNELNSVSNWDTDDDDVFTLNSGNRYFLPPDLSSTSPSNGSTVNANLTTLTLTFNDNVTAGTTAGIDDIQLINVTDGNVPVASFNISDTEVDIDGSATVSIDISGVGGLTDGRTYKVDVAEWIFINADDNHNVAIDGATEWSFTVDGVAPTVSSINRDPAVTTNANFGTSASTVSFIVTFSEDIIPGTLSNTDFVTAGTASGGTETINPTITGSGDTYTVTVDNINQLGLLTINFTGAIDDLVGNTGSANRNGDQSFTIINPEPSQQPTAFNAVPGTDNFTLNTSWTPGAGAQLADGYLLYIVGPTGSFPADPADLTAQADDTDFSDDVGVINTTTASEIVSGLNSGTQYNFRIFPFTNSGNQIDYKTDATILTGSGTTSTGQVSALSFTASAPTVSSLVNSLGASSNNFSFTITDDGASPGTDNAPMLINQVVINVGTGNDIDWTDAIAGVQLSDGTNVFNTDVNGGDITITDTQITFSNVPNGTGQLGEILDNASKTYSLSIWLRNPIVGAALQNTIDGLNFVFEVNDTGIGYSPGSSQLAGSQSVNSGATNNAVSVVATALNWEVQPPATAGVLAPFTSAPVVEAVDANGNRDINYTSAVTALTNTDGIAMNNSPADLGSTFTSGIYTFDITATGFNYADAGNGTLTITSAGLTPSPPSNTVTVSYSNGTTIVAGPDPEPTIIPSTQTAINNINAYAFDFTITDDASAVIDDNAATTITQLVISAAGGANTLTTNWSDVIEEALLFELATFAGVSVDNSAVNDNSITFSVPPSLGQINDNQSKNYRLYIALKSPVTGGMDDLIDNLFINFHVTDLQITTAATSSTMAGSQSVTSGATNNQIQVIATQLVFQEQPSSTFVNETMAPAVAIETNDAQGNRDLDYSGAVNITSTGSLSSAPVTANLTNGVGTASNIVHDVIASGLQLTATEVAPVLAVANSSTFDILAGINESDIVASAFTYEENILYANFTTNPVSNTDPKVFEFEIRDGTSGGTPTDIDNSPTNVTGLEFNVTNIAFLSEIGLFDNTNTLIATGSITGSTVSFDLSGSPVVVSDNGSVTLHIRTTFNTTVTDNEQITFTVSNAQASDAGSTFESADGAPTAGAAATSSVTGDDNRIEVVADQLVFNNIPGASLNTPFLPVLQVNARDVNNNLDLDFTEAITSYSNASTTPGTPLATINNPSGNFTGGILQFPAGFQFTEAGDGVTITIETSTFDGTPGAPALSNVFDITSSFNSNITLSSTQPARIDYINYLTNNITGASDAFELARFSINDGGNNGGTDLDGANTILNDITFDITNADNINRIAIYDGTTEIAELPGNTSPITFSGLAPNLVALDDNSKEFIVYVTFDPVDVIDLENHQITITNAVESGGSQFEFDQAGITDGMGAQTPPGVNIIDVIATQYSFTQQPSPIEGVNIDWDAAPVYPEVTAVDTQNNIDLEINETISGTTFEITTPGAPVTCTGCTFVNGVLDLAGLRYVGTGNGTLTINDLTARNITSGASIAVDVVNTRFNDLTNGIAPSTLQAGDGNLAIFGFGVRSTSQTISEPILEGFTIHLTTSTFEDIRIFESTDDNFENAFSEMLIDDGTNPGFNLTENANEIVVTNFNEDLSDGSTKFFFVVVDVSPNVDQNTSGVTPVMSAADIQISSGSITNFNLTGNTFDFLDVSPPQILSRSPEGDNIDPTTDITIQFNEAVIPLDSVIRVFNAIDQTLAASYRYANASADSTSFVFSLDAGGLANDTDYYINIAEGNVGNLTGFVDNAVPANAFPGITNTVSWTFQTADAAPPVFVVNPSADFIFTEGFDVKVQIDEPGRIYYAVVLSSQPAITEAEHVIDPLDVEGNGNPYPGLVIESDSIDVNAGFQDNYISITGLSNNQNYVTYVIAVDEAGNLMDDTAPGIPFPVNVTTLLSSPGNQIIISSPVVNLCVGDYQEITEPIHILEGGNNDFANGNGQTLNLTLPADFQFNLDSVPEVSFLNNGNITAASVSFLNSAVVQISYDVNNTNELDRLTLRGLYLRANANAVGGDIVRLGGSAVQDGSIDGTIHASITIDPEVPALFDPNLPRTIGNNETQFALIADASISGSGSNTFSGPGVFGDTLYVPIAGIGTHTVTLTHTTENGCVSSIDEDFTVFDNSQVIGGLEVNYCTNDLGAFTIAGANNKVGFDLFELSIDPNTTDPSINTSGILVDNGNSWTIDFTGAGTGQVGFNARFRNRSNGMIDTRPRTQTVTISDPPSLTLDLINNAGPNNDFINFCEEGDIIEITGDIDNRDPSAIYIETIIVDINADDILGDDQTGLTDNGDGTAVINIVDLANNTSFNFGDPIDIIYEVLNNSTTCTEIIEYRIFINPKPAASITNERGCVNAPVTFSAITSGATVQEYDWNFDDPTNLPDFSDQANPVHEYIEDGIYDVTLSVTSDLGCRSDVAARQIRIGNNPVPNYTFEQIGFGDPTVFDVDESIDIGILPDSIDVVNWSFTERANGNTINRTIINDASNSAVTPVTDITFTSLGIKDVTIEIISKNNCSRVLEDSLFIVPLEFLDDVNTYQADFEGSTEDWIPWGSNTSWTITNSGGATITESADAGLNGKTDFWVTGTGDYNADEISFVYSPIFDITEVGNPLLTLNTFRDALGEDGALIEYSFVGYATNGTSDWQLLGDLDESGGIENWYNQRDIGTFSVSNLNDNPRDEGWTESDSLWRESKQSLTEVKAGGNRFQLRIGFISSPFGDKTDGFAFDNVFIGQGTRTVLIENFTNSSQAEDTKNNADILINSYINGINDATDAVVINYHTDFPGIDPINNDNPIDPSARALFYGFSSSPSVIIDGMVPQTGPFTTDWLTDQVGFRALNLAPFNINIDMVTDAGNLVINTSITELFPDVGNDLLVYAAVLEKDVEVTGTLPSGETEFRYVLRKLLPNAAGLAVDIADIESPLQFSWNPEGDIDPSDMAVVVFIQDETTKEIYQSAIRTSAPAPDNITGLDDILTYDGIKLFPNPANQKVTLLFGRELQSPVPVLIYDTFGKLVFEQEIAPGSERFEVDTHDFVPGMYHVQLKLPNDDVVQQRLMVMHRY